MNILVVSGRIAAPEWTSGAMGARLARGLAGRGHVVSVACEAVEDARVLAGMERVDAYGSFRSGASEYAAGFPRWARERMRLIDHAVSLSLSGRVGGHVWMPLDPGGESFLLRALAGGGWFGAAAAALRHSGTVMDAAARRFSPLPRGETIRRTVCIGGPAAIAARRYAGGILSEGVIQAPLVSAVGPVDARAFAAERVALRGLLGIDPGRFVLLASFMHGGGRSLRALMEAVASLNRGTGEGPTLLVLAYEPFKAHAAALRAGCEPHCRVLGTTAGVRSALAACDATLVCTPCPVSAFESGSTSRFAADSLRCGRPVLAAAGSGGEAAAELSTPESGLAGLTVESATADDWELAIGAAMGGDWLRGATAAAERLSGQLGFSRLVDAVETALAEAAA